jgi:PadR family transcriptional regulator PadR
VHEAAGPELDALVREVEDRATLVDEVQLVLQLVVVRPVALVGRQYEHVRAEGGDPELLPDLAESVVAQTVDGGVGVADCQSLGYAVHTLRSEVLKGHLDLLLLAAIAKEPLHGYAVVEAIREASDGALDLAEGTVYPALYRLEGAGFLASSWTTVRGRRRRVYRLTRRGRARLERERKDWEAFSGAVQAVTA